VPAPLYKMRISEDAFSVRIYMDGSTKVQWKLQASSFHHLGSTLISQWVSQDTIDYIKL